MRILSQIFLRGLATIVPVALTLYLVYWLAVSSESLLGGLLKLVLPTGTYWPGMGVLAGIGLTFAAGLLVHAWVIRRLWRWTEKLLESIPLVKTVYTGLRDIFSFASGDAKQQGLNKVVRVCLPNNMKMIGFVTSEAPTWRTAEESHVAVYIPLSYQIGGHTLLISPDKLEPLDMKVEDAMRLVLTAGMQRN